LPSIRLDERIGLDAPAENVIAENGTLRALGDYFRAARNPEAIILCKAGKLAPNNVLNSSLG